MDFLFLIDNNLKMEIIYQDKDLVVVNKLAGVASEEVTPALFLAHRLDKYTSGVLVLARNENTQAFLRAQFKERKVKKEYFALVLGAIKNKSGVIDLPIGRSGGKFFKRISAGKLRGTVREARTEYRVLENFLDFKDAKDGLALVAVFPKTGRTHQIRSHFAAIGHPLVCDKLYAGKRFICPFGLNRQFLHAFAIELGLPTGARIRLEAQMPKDLQLVLAQLRKTSKDDKVHK